MALKKRETEARDTIQITKSDQCNTYRLSLPALYFRILPLVFGNCRLPKVGLAREFKTHLHWAKEV